MWNLESKVGLFVHPKIKNPGLNVVYLDFNEIVNFLNQEDFDINKVDEFDRLLCDIMYNDISSFTTVFNMYLVDVNTGKQTEPNSLTIIFNSSYDTCKCWLIEFLMTLHIDIYSVNPFKHTWYLSDEKKHMNKTQKQIMLGISYGKVVYDLFPSKEEWEKFVNQIFPEDVKKYYTSFVSIYDREVNRNNLKKVVKSGFPKKKKALKKLTNSLKETIGLLDEYLKYVLDNILWLETEK